MSRKWSRVGAGAVPDETVLQCESQPPASLHCSICLELFGNSQREPVSLSVCGHSFCRECTTSSLTAKRQCPNCRRDCARTGAVSSLFNPNFSVKDALDELRVHCRFGLRADGADGWEKDPEGCPACVKRANKATHELKCDHRRIQCPYIDNATVPLFCFGSWSEWSVWWQGKECPHACKHSELAQHQQECKLVPVACGFEGCDSQPSKSQLVNHRKQCEHRPQPCPNKCGRQVTLVRLAVHRELCIQQENTCGFSGCGVRMVEAEHNEQNMPKHLSGLQQQNIVHQQENTTQQQQIDMLQQEVQQMKQHSVEAQAALENRLTQQFNTQLQQLAASINTQSAAALGGRQV